MEEDTLQRKLEDLRHECSALREVLLQAPACKAPPRPGVLDSLRRSLDDLRVLATEPPSDRGPAAPGSNGVVHGASNGDDGLALEHLQTLLESENRRSAIIDASLDAVITMDQGGCIVEFSAAAERMFGYPRQEALGRELLSLIIPARMHARVRAGFALLSSQQACGLPIERFGTCAVGSNGLEFPIEVSLVPIDPGSSSLVTIYVCDVTARKGAEQELLRYQARLRLLMADLLLVEERERRRLAGDLHDGLSQTLALAKIKLLAMRSAADPAQGQALDDITLLIDQADHASRTISFELSPPVLHDFGLEPAVQWLVENIGARYGLKILLTDDALPKPTDEKTRVILFRSIRELLINAAKHAESGQIHVRLERAGDDLGIVVDDDGVGMDPAATGLRGSGLFSIQERLAHVGGSMRIESTPGKGTQIRLRAPLDKERLETAGQLT